MKPNKERSSFVLHSLSFFPQRSYAERIRGEARKKWLQQIVKASQVSGTSLEPVYKAVFQALYRVGLPLTSGHFQIHYLLGITFTWVVFQALFH